MTFKSSDLAERSPARTLAQRWSSGPSGIERVAHADTILEQIRVTPRAASETAALARIGGSGAVLDDLRRAIADPADTLTAIAAVHALAATRSHRQHLPPAVASASPRSSSRTARGLPSLTSTRRWSPPSAGCTAFSAAPVRPT